MLLLVKGYDNKKVRSSKTLDTIVVKGLVAIQQKNVTYKSAQDLVTWGKKV